MSRLALFKAHNPTSKLLVGVLTRVDLRVLLTLVNQEAHSLALVPAHQMWLELSELVAPRLHAIHVPRHSLSGHLLQDPVRGCLGDDPAFLGYVHEPAP